MIDAQATEDPVAGEAFPPYADAAEELSDQLHRLNALLSRAIDHFRERLAPEHPRGLDGVAVFDAEVDAFLTAAPRWREHDGVAHATARLHCELRAHASAARNVSVPLDAIRSRFGLGAYEFDALLLCVAAELHPGYGRVFAYLNNDLTRSRPGLALLVEILAQNWAERLEVRRALSQASPLFRYALLATRGAGDDPSAELAADPGLLDFVLAGRVVPGEREAYGGEMDLADVLVSAGERVILERIVRYLQQNASDSPRQTIVVLSGAPGAGRRTIARAICREFGCGLRIADRYPSLLADMPRRLRDARLSGDAPGIRVPAAAPEHEPLLHEVFEVVEELPCGLAFLFVDADEAPRLPQTAAASVLAAHIGTPPSTVRTTAWKRALREHGLEAPDEDVRTLAAVYPFSVGRIYASVREADVRLQATLPGECSVGIRELAEAARSRTNHRLDQLAQPLPTRFNWEDIVLPADELCRLKEIANAVRNRDRVMERWGFDEKVCAGPGVNAIFFGPSGTGKTMAASILAAELGMAIYRVDLSRVVSKYIGETERNLDALFEEARRSFAVLFFDEAEAIFGKRSEVKDAHDRYANIEVAYLLQRMEGFEGVAILATNLRKNMDNAFLRRLQFAVEFPLPSFVQRLQIWRQVWPAAAELSDDLDLEFMANRFELSGGHIRNVAMMAAYLACEDGMPIAMVHLVAATRREFQKLGRNAIAGQFGEYASLLGGARPGD